MHNVWCRRLGLGLDMYELEGKVILYFTDNKDIDITRWCGSVKPPSLWCTYLGVRCSSAEPRFLDVAVRTSAQRVVGVYAIEMRAELSQPGQIGTESALRVTICFSFDYHCKPKTVLVTFGVRTGVLKRRCARNPLLNFQLWDLEGNWSKLSSKLSQNLVNLDL